MSTRAKILTAVAVIFFVCLVVWVVRTTPDTPPPLEKFDPPTVMEYEGNTLTEERDGVIIWELTCEKMRVDSVTQNMELTGVKGKFYQRDEKNLTWELSAARGIYYKTDNIIYVEGDINLTNSDGAKLTCDMLEWFSAEEKLAATDNVNVLNSDGATLAADKVEWFSAEERIVATGNVKLAKDDMRGFGDTASADSGFKHFKLVGHARILKGVKSDAEVSSLQRRFIE